MAFSIYHQRNSSGSNDFINDNANETQIQKEKPIQIKMKSEQPMNKTQHNNTEPNKR